MILATKLLGDQIKNERQQQQEEAKEILRQLVPQAGQKLYELNIATNVITVIDHKTATSIELPKKFEVSIIHNEIKAKDTCIYVLAINERNAIKKFIKMLSK